MCAETKKPRYLSLMVAEDTKRGWERTVVLEAREWAASREAVLARGDAWRTWVHEWTVRLPEDMRRD